MPVGEGAFQTTVELGPEFLVGRAAGWCERAHDDLRTRREPLEPFPAQMAEAALDTMTDDGAADGTTDHEADARGVLHSRVGVADEGVHDQEGTTAPAPGANSTRSTTGEGICPSCLTVTVVGPPPSGAVTLAIEPSTRSVVNSQ